MLADRIGLTSAFRGVLARPGFFPGRDRGRMVADTVAALAAGASCLSDVEAMTAQVELFGKSGVASATTVLRVLGEYADRLTGNGLPGRALSRAMASVWAGAWERIVARHDGMPAVQVAGQDLAWVQPRTGTLTGRDDDVEDPVVPVVTGWMPR